MQKYLLLKSRHLIHIDNQSITFESYEIVIKLNSTWNIVSRGRNIKNARKTNAWVHFWGELRIVAFLYVPSSPALFKHRHNSDCLLKQALRIPSSHSGLLSQAFTEMTHTFNEKKTNFHYQEVSNILCSVLTFLFHHGFILCYILLMSRM